MGQGCLSLCLLLWEVGGWRGLTQALSSNPHCSLLTTRALRRNYAIVQQMRGGGGGAVSRDGSLLARGGDECNGHKKAQSQSCLFTRL